MRWSVSVQASGERVLQHEEIVELADAVAGWQGVASGIGSTTYGAQLVVDAKDRDEAIERGCSLFAEAAARAGLPPWPVTSASAVSEAEDELDGIDR